CLVTSSPLALASSPLYSLFTHTPTPEIYPLSLHDALPICCARPRTPRACARRRPRSSASSRRRCESRGGRPTSYRPSRPRRSPRSEEHTSELQSPDHLVCRLLLEKKKKNIKYTTTTIQTPQ